MKKIKFLFCMILIITLVIIPQTSCKYDTPIATDTNYYLLNTISKIDIYTIDKNIACSKLKLKNGTDEECAKEAIRQAFVKCADYEKILSKTKKNSDVYRINHAGCKAIKVTDDTIKVVKMGVKYGKVSKGNFDITIGAVTDLWNFGSPNPKVPTKADLNKVIKTVNYKDIRINERDKTIQLRRKGAVIDLGGIAKGYICDKMAQYLKSVGVSSAVINLGGNITVIGAKPSGEGFNIGIERPYSDRTSIIGSINSINKTLVTSGVYERCFKEGNKTYHHILDVKTGYPKDTDVELVTIVSDIGKSAVCDGLSTTCLTLGVKQGMELIESIDGVEAVFVDKNDKITRTSGAELTE